MPDQFSSKLFITGHKQGKSEKLSQEEEPKENDD